MTLAEARDRAREIMEQAEAARVELSRREAEEWLLRESE